MSNDAQRWKDKYLASLEQQETQERRWEERLDLLRRGLVRSSLAAEGSDKAVDQCMQELRDIVRGEQMDAGLAGLIPRLEKAVLDSEQRRQQRVQQNVGALAALAQQLLHLELPREVRKPLKQFAKRIDERAGQSREMPALLAELSHLQQQALAHLEQPQEERPGLLQRLFGARDEQPEAATLALEAVPAASELPSAVITPPLVDAAPDAAAIAVAAVPVSSAPAAAEAVIETPVAAVAEPAVSHIVPSTARPSRDSASLDSLPLAASVLLGETSGDPAYALPAGEPGYSAIAPHVADSLRKLLDELKLPDFHQAQADALRERLSGGLNWYELVPALDDLAVLVLAVADGGQREFAGYLKQLNERLADFLGHLSAAHDGYADSLSSARQLDNELREQVSDLQQSVQDAADLPSLKATLESRLEGLLGRMIDYHRQRDSHEQEVKNRLQGLVERVAVMEQEAGSFRERLEVQRQKALVDPLTGLANRAAWNERLELEVARRQRYGGELLLAVLDVDHFKRINDGFGHLAGDKVLKLIAGELARRVRKTDFIARFGGEEFVLLLPGTPLDGGKQLLDTLRQAIEACPFHFKGEPLTITLSGGLSAFAQEDQPANVFERADQALYRAKHAGRNRIELG
ncbi:diguanylate cyclase [Pseudomonas sp. UL073]|uniref:diguanylate cyclase n=1 Tax=Zestomonas insulae TaxID=2809017 RepID=A0ABS2IK64_9GAMM|nr:GGDEF domain-containing protein [Pseudomonas insulae]MBM7062558.1 diguanylate cyclase [Pseudomonas insulae]